MTFNDYVRVDDDVETDEAMTETDIIAELLPYSTVLEGAEEEEDDAKEITIVNPLCSLAEAKKFMHEIRRFFEYSTATKDSDFSNLNKLEFSLSDNFCQKQTSITDFFKI